MSFVQNAADFFLPILHGIVYSTKPVADLPQLAFILFNELIVGLWSVCHLALMVEASGAPTFVVTPLPALRVLSRLLAVCSKENASLSLPLSSSSSTIESLLGTLVLPRSGCFGVGL